MSRNLRIGLFAGGLVLAMMPAMRLSASPGPGKDDDNKRHSDKDTRHVLLISIDGMHAVDFENCVASKTCPALAALGRTGVTYTRTSTSRPSDSFPGLMAIVTGGSPRTVGAFYDVAYDRVLAPPASDTGNGLVHGNCILGVINGTQTEYEEGVEFDQSKVNGGGPYSPFDGGVLSIDPKKLERDPFNGCNPVYPWNFIRTNTIYGVIHSAGLFTAWSDKHPVYAAVSGPTGTSSPTNVDDYYAPEVNSNVVNIPGFRTANGLDCSNISANTSSDWTTDFDSIKCYDQLKVNAVVNWINGKNHLGTATAPVPTILGMNFQAVSVGQKLIENGVKGGYTDAAGDPTPSMATEIAFVDAAIEQIVNALKRRNLLDSTTIIITAKHGQSPIDTNRFFPIPGHSGTDGQPPSAVLAALLPASATSGLGLAEDDISQLWLTKSSDTATAVSMLEANGKEVGLGQLLYGASLNTIFNPPGVPNVPGPCCALREGGDPRTPDIIVLPNVGVVYTGSTKKQSEHGGFAWDDTNVMLLVSNPGIRSRTVHSFVETAQVAPTILQLLGLDPEALDAVRQEGTPVLPGLFESDPDDHRNDHM
jgi:Type I phosphodiesterase / nucleotide pyrophosphatase